MMVRGIDRCITKKEVLAYLTEKKKLGQSVHIRQIMADFVSFLPEGHKKTDRLVDRMGRVIATLITKGLVMSKLKKEIHTTHDSDGNEVKQEFSYSIYSAR